MADEGQLQDELASFRQEWHEEIQRTTGSANHSARNSPCTVVESNSKSTLKTSEGKMTSSPKLVHKATQLFLKGVSLERNGSVYEATRFYRQAIQLVPDIEFKISDFTSISDDEDNDTESEESDLSEDYNRELASLVDRFHQMSVTSHCQPEFGTRMTHVSAIPVELLMYVFKWVVSSDMDFKSLEQLAGVCRGFYACARDPELWKLGCLRVWGLNCGLPLMWNGSWRLMYLQRLHVWTQGVYISKTTYVRQGEQSLDSFYRPYHLVEYYRYMRFNTDGSVFVLTTPEEPINIIPKLKQTNTVLYVMWGHYRFMGDKVFIVVDVQPFVDGQARFKRNKRGAPSPLIENTFHMELEVKSTGRRYHNQLVWSHYSNHRTYRETGQTVESEIDSSRQFPPLYFSPVRSFTQTSVAPLE